MRLICSLVTLPRFMDFRAEVMNIASRLVNERFLGAVFLNVMPLPPEISMVRAMLNMVSELYCHKKINFRDRPSI